MELIQTTVAGNAVRMLLADGDTKENSKQWLEFQTQVDGTADPYLSEVQLAALQNARGAIDAEIRRLAKPSGQNP